MNNQEIFKIKAELSHILFPRGAQEDESTSKIASFYVREIMNQPKEILKVGERYTIKGLMPKLSYNDEYIIYFSHVGYDEKYGNQFKVEYMNVSCDLKTNDDALAYLRRILTDTQYDNIVDIIDNPLEVISKGDKESLLKVSGIGESTANKIIQKYNNSKDYADIYISLEKYKLSDVAINKLIEKYKTAQNVIDKIQENVFILADLDGYGFSNADGYFIKGGGDLRSPKRIKAYINHYLKAESYKGNSWVNTNVFAREIYKVFGDTLDKTVFSGVIRELEEDDIIKYDRDKKRIGLTKMYKLELAIANEFKRIQSGNNLEYREDWEDIVYNLEKVQGWEYNTEQKKGIKDILDNQLVLLTGLGGSGKTTLLKAISQIYGDRYSFSQCALSGCASQRINQVSGKEAQTIHKTLEYSPRYGFTRNKDNPLEVDYLILDEASMVSGDLFLRLLQAIKTGTKLIIVADHGQLESIGVCNVFFDLLKTNICIVKLTEVHRQAKASAIITKSIDIRNGIQLFDEKFKGREILGDLQDLELNIDMREKLQDYAVRQFLYHSKKVGIENVLGVTPMRERGSLSCYELNNKIQSLLDFDKTNIYKKDIDKNKFYIFHVGDKVINIKNNYKTKTVYDEEVPIFNGNIGIIKDIKGKTIIVSFIGVGDIVLKGADINNLELAYFISIHKSQGSEAHTVICTIDYSAYEMLTNGLIYTAMTRARKYCVLVAENNAVRKAIQTMTTSKKQTYLPDFLK